MALKKIILNGTEIELPSGGGNVPTKTSELTNDSGFITANDNVASATKLQTMRYINGSPFDGTNNVVSYAVCATGASTTAKTVSISRFSLATGSQVRVKFSNANTASAPTLNVGSTGAKRMSYKGSLITNANFSFSTAKIYTFTYDGTYWVLEGDWDEALSAEPMICAYTIGSYTARTITLVNHTYNGQTMDYREGAIISVLNPNSTDIVFVGGTVTLDGNEYEVSAFTIKSGATALFSLGPDPGVLLPISSVVESNSGDSSEGGSSSESGSSAYPEVNHGTSDRTFELTPNTFHVWDEMSAMTLTLGAETDGVANEYLFQFTSPATPTSLTLPNDIKFSEDLTIEANKIYQISILKGLGSVLSWDNGVALIENKAIYNEGDFMNGGTLTFEYPTASEIKLYLNLYSSPYLTIPAGTTTITIDWNEPSPPTPQYFEPSFDDTYLYYIIV